MSGLSTVNRILSGWLKQKKGFIGKIHQVFQKIDLKMDNWAQEMGKTMTSPVAGGLAG